ncbi:MAG TPA: hypothetical protein VFK89_07260, partial [Actinomycetota bacterium]|nr:hypothetical protein [Actinomycetota bacterium]
MTDVTREGPLEVLQDLHAAIERGAELEARIATGDKRAAWELVALEKEMGWERPAGPPRKRHPGHWLLLDGLLERDRGVFADGIREAVADGIL